MTDLPGGTFTMVEGLSVTRLGYGAMQLAGPGVFGPPADRPEAVAVLREVVERGITHIDTSDFYGPHVTNEIIREALHPYPADLRLVTKVGARRDADGGWPHARSPGSSARRSTTTWTTSASSLSTSSTCGSAASTDRSRARSPSRSGHSSNCSRRG